MLKVLYYIILISLYFQFMQVVFDERRVNSTYVYLNHKYVVLVYTPHSELIYLYTYTNIKIGNTEGTHMLYVHFIKIRSESCNYTFIDLEFQKFNIFYYIFVCRVLDPLHPLCEMGPLLIKFKPLKNSLDPLLTFKSFCF